MLRSFRITCLTWKRFLRMLLVRSLPVLQRSFPQMGRTSLRPWFMGNKMQFEAVACRLFLHYSYTLAQKASNYGIFCFYHKTCEQFYRHFGLYEKSPNSFLPGLPRSIINQFDFHNFLCLCLASVHLPYPFHLVSAFSFSVTPFRFANSGTISSMRFRAASSILAQYCLTYTQQSCGGSFFVLAQLYR